MVIHMACSFSKQKKKVEVLTLFSYLILETVIECWKVYAAGMGREEVLSNLSYNFSFRLFG